MAENTGKSQRAEVTTVSIGYMEIEGLMLSDGSFAIGVPQLCSLFQFLNKNAARDIKDLLGNDFQFLKLRTTLNPKAINAIQLIDFERLIIELALTVQNPVAKDMLRTLAGLSLHQLFSDAFGQKFDAEDRQQWLKTRAEGKLARRSLTDAIKHYLDVNDVPKEKRATVYANVTDKIYLGLFGCRAKAIKEKLQTTITRDELDNIHLRYIEHAEAMVMRLIDFELLEPLQAVDEALNRLIIPTQKL